MNEIQRPAQIVARQSHQQQERPSDTTPVHHHQLSQPHLLNQIQEYGKTLRTTRLMRLVTPEMPRPAYTSSLLPISQPLLTKVHSSSTIDQEDQNVGICRRINSMQQRSQSPDTGEINSSRIYWKETGQERAYIRDIWHKKRKEEMLKILAPNSLSEDLISASVHLCWGKKDRCQVLPVRIPESTDDVTVWKEIRRAYYEHRGHWRSRLPFFGVKKVSFVELSILGSESGELQDSKPKKHLTGVYEIQDVNARKKRVKEHIANLKQQHSDCAYDTFTGQINCSLDCPSNFDAGYECPGHVLYESRKELFRLRTQSCLTMAFSNPKFASINCLLDGESIIISHLDILSKLNEWYYPELRALNFRALMINEGWDYSMALPLMTTFLFLTVAGAKLLYGDWGIAWNVGRFFVALAGLLWIWTNPSLDF